jgi:hypothetical protein
MPVFTFWSATAIRAYLLAHAEPGPGGCMLWRGSLDKRGYGLAWINGRSYRAARLAYEVWVEVIPEGYHAHHTCQNRACINSAHIEPMPHGEHLRLHSQCGAWAGEKNSRAKLREEEVRHIKMVKGMIPASTVAGYFFVAESTIRAIWDERSWSHITSQEAAGEALDVLQDIERERGSLMNRRRGG